jgi:hypothetical protein
MAHRGSRGLALPCHDHGRRRGWGVSVKPRPLFTPGKKPVPIVHEAGWAPGPVWTGAENLAHVGIRSPDLTTRSQSLYRQSYRAHTLHVEHSVQSETATEVCEKSKVCNMFQNSKKTYAISCLRKTSLHWGVGQCSEFTKWAYRGCTGRNAQLKDINWNSQKLKLIAKNFLLKCCYYFAWLQDKLQHNIYVFRKNEIIVFHKRCRDTQIKYVELNYLWKMRVFCRIYAIKFHKNYNILWVASHCDKSRWKFRQQWQIEDKKFVL